MKFNFGKKLKKLILNCDRRFGNKETTCKTSDFEYLEYKFLEKNDY